METSYLLMLSMVSAAVVGQHSRQVIALSQSSIKLITHFDQVNVKDFTWTFKNQQVYYRIIKIQNDQVVENLHNRYKPTHHGTILGINNLTKSDSGNYTAVITMLDNSMKEENIDLTVYDPVPTPKIESEVKRVEDQCYVTLNCSIPSNTDGVFYTWKYRNNDSEYQNISKTGNAIKIPLYHQDTQFMCKVQNPADHKNATVHVKYCSDPVPTPKIESEVKRVEDQCYVTLNCSIPSNTDGVFYTWKYRNNDSKYQNINKTGNAIKIPLYHQDTQFMCKVQNSADHKNATVHVKYCSEVKTNTTSVVIEVVILVVLVVVTFLVWWFKFSKRSSNTSEQDNQKDEVKTSQKENTVEEDENYKNKNEECLRDSVQNTDVQDEGQTGEDENEMKEHKRKDEHQNEDNLTRPVPEIGIHRVWTTGKKENEVKKHKKEDEHRNKGDWDDRVRKDEVEENEKKDDNENYEGSSLLGKTAIQVQSDF